MSSCWTSDDRMVAPTGVRFARNPHRPPVWGTPCGARGGCSAAAWRRVLWPESRPPPGPDRVRRR